MWEPAADLEQRMRDALRAGNREEYFQLLARAELLLPLSGEGTPNEPATWATWATDDRTHVLAFTSEDALRSCLRGHAGQYRLVRFTSLADMWPDPDWWLAVNPGMPIEGYLPAWYVAQLASGDPTVPEQFPAEEQGYGSQFQPNDRGYASPGEQAAWHSREQAP
ncbi:MAG: SseB family protein, partial [Stackebrandtia sp.]